MVTVTGTPRTVPLIVGVPTPPKMTTVKVNAEVLPIEMPGAASHVKVVASMATARIHITFLLNILLVLVFTQVIGKFTRFFNYHLGLTFEPFYTQMPSQATSSPRPHTHNEVTL